MSSRLSPGPCYTQPHHHHCALVSELMTSLPLSDDSRHPPPVIRGGGASQPSSSHGRQRHSKLLASQSSGRAPSPRCLPPNTPNRRRPGCPNSHCHRGPSL